MSETTPKARSTRIQTKSKQRRQKHKEDLRLAILDAATELFLKHGYEKFSLRQVAEVVGYSPTTIYHHFQDKDELLFHVSLEGFRNFGEALQNAYDSKDTPLDRLKSTGDAYLEFGLSFPVQYRLMFMQRPEMFFEPGKTENGKTEPGKTESGKDDCKKFEMPKEYANTIDAFGILQKIVQECIDEKIFQDIDNRLLSGIIWSNIHGVVSLCISGVGVDEGAARAIHTNGHRLLFRGLQQTKT